MKKSFFKSILLSALAFVGCHHNAPADTADVDTTYTDINQFCPENYDHLYAFQDQPQFMPVELFEGTNDSLLHQLLPDSRAEASINVFLLCGQGRNILFDAGMGAGNGGRLMRCLDSVGVSPEAVTDICITHLHFDHVGGLLNADMTPAFPNAVIHVSDVEYEAWTTGCFHNDPGLVPVIGLAYEGRIVQHNLAVDSTFLPGIVATLLPDHTPGHTCYALGQNLIIAGDVLHALTLQLEHPEFCARFDFDKAAAVQSRTALLSRSDKPYVIAGMHFPAPHFFVIQ